jgi:hypothetical protein
MTKEEKTIRALLKKGAKVKYLGLESGSPEKRYNIILPKK